MNHPTNTAMTTALTAALLMLVLTALSGCGQMGPLYLPVEAAAEAPVVDTAEEVPALEEPVQEEFGIDSRDGEFGSKAQ